MNLDFAAVVTLMTIYLFVLLLALWWNVISIRHHINQAVNLIRQQRSENLQWLHESLLTAIRLQSAGRR